MEYLLTCLYVFCIHYSVMYLFRSFVHFLFGWFVFLFFLYFGYKNLILLREVWLFPQLLVVSKPLEKVSLLNWRHGADQTTTTQFRVEALSHINNEI